MQDDLNDLDPQRRQIVEAARRMIARGMARDQVDAFVDRAEGRLARNATDQRNAGALSRGEKAATLLERAIGSAGFGVGSLVGDAASAALDPNQSFADVRRERNARDEQVGAAAGIAADFVGGLVTGKAGLQALATGLAKTGTGSAVKVLARDLAERFGGETLKRVAGNKAAGMVARGAVAATDAAAQAGVSGWAGGLDEASVDGLRRAGRSAARSAKWGAGLAGPLGAFVGKQAGARAARVVGNADMRTAGIDPKTAETLERVTPEVSESVLDKARQYVSEAVRLGRGQTVNAADALDEVGAATLRAAANVSQEGRGIAKSRLRQRDANVGARVLQDIGETTGQTPGDMALAKRGATLEKQRVANALYGQAEGEGTWFDAARRGGRTLPSEANAMADEAVALERAAMQDEVVQAWIGKYQRQDPQRWKRANAGRFMPMLQIHQALAKQMRTLESQGKVGTPEYDGVARAWEKTGAALDARSPTLPKADAAYRDFMQAGEAYDDGAAALNANSGEDARQAMIAAGDYSPTFRKGYVDALAQRVKEKAPNPNLEEAARASRQVPQDAVDTMAEAERLSAVLGPEVRQGMEARARVEGRQSRTSNAVQGNSTTAPQGSDMGKFADLVQDATAAISANPAWWATMFGRRVASHLAKVRQERRAEEVGKLVSDMMTRTGVENTLNVLYGIPAIRARRVAEAKTGQAVARLGRSAGARASAQDDR